jgi:chemotaxis protein MotA
MDPTVFIGIIIGVGLLLQAIGKQLGIDAALELFFHPDSLLIVLGGTLGATFVHFPISQLFKIGSRLKKIFSLKRRN